MFWSDKKKLTLNLANWISKKRKNVAATECQFLELCGFPELN